MRNFFKHSHNNDYASTLDNKYHEYCNEVLLNSKAQLNEMKRNGEAYGNKQEVNFIESSIKFLEEAFDIYQMRPEVIEQLLKVKFIVPLPISERNKIYGQMLELPGDKFGIYLSPNLSGNGILNAHERTRLYCFHELGHVINAAWMENALDLIKILIEYSEVNWDIKDVQKFYDGFSLLDEAITQERAEEIAYVCAGKNRPSYRKKSFCNVCYETNFDFYGELQLLAGLFAQTLRGIGKFEDSFYALNVLSKRALKPDFLLDVVQEYSHDGCEAGFRKILPLMGEIKEASYANFGIGSMPNNMKDTLFSYINTARSLRDYREKN